jgi:predicted aspartyl protease
MTSSRLLPILALMALVAGTLALLSLLAAPPSLLPAALPPGAPKGEIAVRVLPGAHHEALLVARVVIDGKGPFPFLVDTGAAISVINAPLAKELHLAIVTRAAGRLQAAGCTSRSGEDRVSHWRTGDVALPAVELSTVAMSPSVSSSTVQGLLGSDLWDQFGSLEIDYSRSLVRIGVVPPGRSVAVRVLHSDNEVVVVAPVEIDGRGPYPFVVDTGASDSVVSTSLDQSFHFHQVTHAVTVAAVGCSSKASLVRLGRWSTGSVGLPGGVALDLHHPLGADTPGPIGILGSSALSRFGQVTIDYADDRLIFPQTGPGVTSR